MPEETLDEHSLISLGTAALLCGMTPKAFLRRAMTIELWCRETRDGRGTMRHFRLGDVMQKVGVLREKQGPAHVYEQRDRCILALRRGLRISFQDIANIVGGMGRQRVHSIVGEQIARERDEQDILAEALDEAQRVGEE